MKILILVLLFVSGCATVEPEPIFEPLPDEEMCEHEDIMEGKAVSYTHLRAHETQ